MFVLSNESGPRLAGSHRGLAGLCSYLCSYSSREESASGFIQVVRRTHFLVVVGPRAPTSCRLLTALRALRLPSASGQESPVGLLSWLFISSQLARERESVG